ncbi:hypothetical protein VOLCADRAFT_95277 [Volvox carteri f. nagariensis]|uniref:Uncharacterized protein n=1 Tax=Volvox carteri f. nagariensis TaxID=3068 RepID=D8U727_VOLCA|nr:uncharacterized protein VOLCADRAFT_95277 [Volvox carteri f. nagariensis]EFJ44355.1 hypothetical protein VOLCADRAFT_95277 [Volvox carteri f. nagariensis]|eukprot:XP_002954462.1 hypothetical protein VOLCADRAFT_95277 [Volvox carteri f. nagariensis]
MSMSLDDSDAEAAFEEELSRLKLQALTIGQEHTRLLGVDAAYRSNAAFERRERAAEEFGRDWQRFCVEVVSIQSSGQTLDSDVFSDAPVPGLPVRSCLVSCGPLFPTIDSTRTQGHRGESKRMAETQGECHTDRCIPTDPLRGGVVLDATVLASVLESHGEAAQDRATADFELNGRAGASRDSARCPGLQYNLNCTDANVNQAQPAAAEEPSSNAITPVMVDAHVLDAETDAGISMERVLDLENLRRLRMLENLKGEVAKVAVEQREELVAYQEEESQSVAAMEATFKQLDLVMRKAAEREALKQAHLAALQQEALAMGRQHLAAWRICRAWRRYHESPARAARLAAAVRIQAGWRGYMRRRRAAHLQCTRMDAAEGVAMEGKTERVDLATGRASMLGLHDALQARLTAFEAVTPKVASRAGSLLEYQTACAEAAVWAAVAGPVLDPAGQPISSFYRVLEAAAQQGVDSKRLTAALAAVRDRDAQLLAKLAAASRAPKSTFNLAEFEVLVERALHLGLTVCFRHPGFSGT